MAAPPVSAIVVAVDRGKVQIEAVSGATTAQRPRDDEIHLAVDGRAGGGRGERLDVGPVDARTDHGVGAARDVERVGLEVAGLRAVPPHRAGVVEQRDRAAAALDSETVPVEARPASRRGVHRNAVDRAIERSLASRSKLDPDRRLTAGRVAYN